MIWQRIMKLKWKIIFFQANFLQKCARIKHVPLAIIIKMVKLQWLPCKINTFLNDLLQL